MLDFNRWYDIFILPIIFLYRYIKGGDIHQFNYGYDESILNIDYDSIESNLTGMYIDDVELCDKLQLEDLIVYCYNNSELNHTGFNIDSEPIASYRVMSKLDMERYNEIDVNEDIKRLLYQNMDKIDVETNGVKRLINTIDSYGTFLTGFNSENFEDLICRFTT